MPKSTRDDSHRDTRRRFEQWARNPQCQANVISAVHNIPMARVAEQETGRSTMGQSPFAIARGQAFEKSLFRNGGRLLLEALKRSRVLPDEAAGLADFRMRMHGGTCRNLDEALAGTADLLRRLAAKPGRPGRPWLVAGATVRIPGNTMLPEALLVIDALGIRHDESPPTLIVGEIKTYPDRGGYTDRQELATARAQAGVYVHGLDLVLAELDLTDEYRVARQGFLVLTRPGFNRPSIRVGEDLRYQAERAKRGFVLLERAAASMPGPSGTATPDSVIAAPISYSEACVSFCDRADTCRAKALEAGCGSVLGDDVARFLGATTLQRALDLLAGSTPANAAEQDLKRRMQDIEGLRSWR
ncbi:MAG TPA: hypothetical protein PLE61_04365 [Vicinamibacterales bacterium]|nr:hypothetical protein [Vicinamibacterales bacterium]